MKTNSYILITTIIISTTACNGFCLNIDNNETSIHLNNASVVNKDNTLTVSTGLLERQWKWTGKGLITTGLKNISSGRQWVNGQPHYDCDWSLPGFIDDGTEAKLIAVTANQSNDGGFTSEHIEVIATIEYPKANLAVKYIIWVYPSCPGIRTQIKVKALPGFKAAPRPEGASGRVDYIPVSFENMDRQAIGYYNHTQFRNSPETELIREERITTPLASKAFTKGAENRIESSPRNSAM